MKEMDVAFLALCRKEDVARGIPALREFVIPPPAAFRRIVLGLTTFCAQVSASWLGLLIGSDARATFGAIQEV